MGKKTSDFKKGDFLVSFGKVYKIIKVEEKSVKGSDNKQLQLVYTPHFDDAAQSLICRIPLSNITATTTRKPVTQSVLSKLLDTLEKPDDSAITHITAENALKTNDLEEIVTRLRQLWTEKKDTDTSLSFSKKNALEKLMRALVQEVALVTNTSISEAKQRVLKLLQ